MSGSSLAPISYASSIVGFISFAFTFTTFLNVFWEGFSTVASAPAQVRDYLSLLRQELYEERDHLRRHRRRYHHDDEVLRADGDISKIDEKVLMHVGMLRVLSDTVRDLIREFKGIERFFLMGGERERELGEGGVPVQPAYRCDLVGRVRWWKYKGKVEELAVRLNRLQTRRIAREVGEERVTLQNVERDMRGIQDRLWSIERQI
ncbi:MAG: hypothetical protein M1836_006887 [Candelina mexicana]|nr:MAG: hypothetical protein M1836_006887 [Candelina mexicana]